MNKGYDHLVDRGMNPDLYNTIYYDAEEDEFTFMLHNGARQVVGYQIYRPWSTDKKINDPMLGRYYNYLPRGIDGVFGAELLDPSKKEVYIVEGTFKAGVLHRLGFNAIAVLTNSPKRMRSWFTILRATYDLIAIGDNDLAGARLVRTIGKGFQSPIDLDEMEDADILELLSGGT